MFFHLFWRSARSVRLHRLQGRHEGEESKPGGEQSNAARRRQDIVSAISGSIGVERCSGECIRSKRSRATSHDKQSRCTYGRRPEIKTAQTCLNGLPRRILGSKKHGRNCNTSMSPLSSTRRLAEPTLRINDDNDDDVAHNYNDSAAT